MQSSGAILEPSFCSSTPEISTLYQTQKKKDRFNIDEPCHLSFADLRSLEDDILMGHLQKSHSDALGVLFDRYHRLVLHVA